MISIMRALVNARTQFLYVLLKDAAMIRNQQ